MKTNSTPVVLLCLAMLLSPRFVHAEPPAPGKGSQKPDLPARLKATAARAPNFNPLAVELAQRFLRGEDASPARLEAFVEEEEIAGEAFLGAFLQAVATGQAMVESGIAPGSRHFHRLLADAIMPPGSSSPPGAVARQSPPTPENAKTGETRSAIKSAKAAVGEDEGKTVPTESGAKARNYKSFVQGGVRSLRAYELSPAGDLFELKAKSNATTSYAEFVYWDALAIDPDRLNYLRQVYPNKKNPGKLENWLFGDGSLSSFDFQARFGYTFDKEKNSSAAIVGSGDFNAELTLSKVLYAAADVGEKTGKTIGFDASYGVVTDTSSLDVHHRAFAGLSFAVAFPAPLSDRGAGIFHLRGGWAGLDTVSFIDQTGNLVAGNRGRPAYDWKSFGAIEAEAVYPIGKDLVIMGARIYSPGKSKLTPSTWSLSIGYSKPLESFINFGLPTEIKKTEEKTGK